MKRIWAILLAGLMLVVLFAVPVSAAGGKEVSDWKLMSGYKVVRGREQAELVPGKLTKTAEGINYTCNGYYQTGLQQYAGIFYNERLTVDGLKLEIKVNNAPGAEIYGDDLWFSVGILEKQQVFDNTNPAYSQGIVATIRPDENSVNLRLQENVIGLNWGNTGIKISTDYKYKPTSTFTFEFKKNASNDSFLMYFNGKKVNSTIYKLWPLLEDGKGYLYIGTSTDTGEDWDITITSLNGVSLASEKATTKSSTQTTAGKTTTQKNSTNTNNPGQTTGTTKSGATSATAGDTTSTTAADTTSTTAADTTSTTAADTVSTTIGGTTITTVGDVSGEDTAEPSTSASETETTAPIVVPPADLEDKDAVKVKGNKFKIDYEEKTISLKQGMTFAEFEEQLTFAEGYSFKYYDISDQEITDKTQAITALHVALLYGGDELRGSYEFVLSDAAVNGESGTPGWVVPVVIVGVLIVLGGAVAAVLILKKRGADREKND